MAFSTKNASKQLRCKRETVKYYFMDLVHKIRKSHYAQNFVHKRKMAGGVPLRSLKSVLIPSLHKAKTCKVTYIFTFVTFFWSASSLAPQNVFGPPLMGNGGFDFKDQDTPLIHIFGKKHNLLVNF